MTAPPGTEAELKAALREWVAARNPGIEPGAIEDGTPLIEARYLTSLQVAELLLFVEELRRAPVDPASFRPGVFRTIDAIYDTFFAGAGGP